MATATTSDMPLANELSVVNYLRNMLGVSSSGTATAGQVGNTLQAVGGVSTPGVATGGTAVAGQAEELTQDQLSTIMTEWLRGNGQFLDSMRQQNVSGLYNTSTQKLVANDLTAQAALKAATANQEIQKANAALTTNANIATAQNQTSASQTTAQQATQSSMANAQNQTSASQTNAQAALQAAISNVKNQTDTSLANAKSGTSSRTDSLINTALAALMNAYKGSGNKKSKSESATWDKNASSDGGITTTQMDAGSFNRDFQSSRADTNFLLDSSYEPTSIVTAPSYDFGSNMVQSLQTSPYDIPELAPVDLGEYSKFIAPEVMNFGQTATEAPSYDFTPVDYTSGADNYRPGSTSADFWTPAADYQNVDSGGDYKADDWTTSDYIPTFKVDNDEIGFNFSWSF